MARASAEAVPLVALVQSVRFGAYEVDVVGGTLRRLGVAMPLRRQTWQLLCVLAAHPHRLCSKAALMATLWPRTVVGDDSLVQCVVELRRALGEDGPRLLRTVARLGYRFEMPLSPGTRAAVAVAGMPTSGPLDPAWQLLTTAQGVATVIAARDLFEAASNRAVHRADAMAGVALSHVIEVLNRWASCPAWSVTLAREAAEEAMALDPANARACHARAHVAMQEGRPFDALLGFRAALGRDPTMARARLRMGVIEMELGRPELTAGHVASALALDVEGNDEGLRAQAWFIEGMAAFQLGRDEAARASMDRVLGLRPADALAHEWIASIDALAGAMRSGADHLELFRRSLPSHTLESLRETERSRHPLFKHQRDRLYDGLRRAGLQ
ncbi:MAG: winged helix-turn-helix domain-containing protein [Caldimonas sp.]